MRMEIDEKKEELNELVKEMVKKEKGFSDRLNEALGENKKMSDNLIAIQKKRDLLKAKVDIYEKKRKDMRKI